MRKLFTLVAILGLGVAVVGCSEQKKAAPAKPAETPAAPPAEAPK